MADEIRRVRTQVAGREKNIEQQPAEWLDKAYADLETERSGRCPNCDHQTRFHSAGGCWFTLATGKPDANLVCPCAVVKP